MAEKQQQLPPATVTVNFGDGTPQETATLGVAVPHRYARPGRYGVSASKVPWAGQVDVHDAPGMFAIVVEPGTGVATAAVAGNPGHFTPVDCTIPATGADIATLPARPLTHWPQFDHVTARNGDERWWDGERWRNGRATAPVPAAGANAGQPGVFTPPGCVTPVNGNAIAPLAALPLTHWQPGEYVRARNGVEAYWDGRFWQHGRAPIPPVDATGATAGTPGYFTPTGARTPQTGADIEPLTASPQTLWFAGQYVRAVNSEERYWDGSAWQPGRSPAPPVVATGATMGRPGFYTPTGAVTPATGADINTLTASPQTAWTPETWVQAVNSDERYWDGSAWQPGRAPGFIQLPPIASFTYIVDELDVTYNASGSRDPDGTVVSYAWDLGDGDTSTSEFFVHSYDTVDTFDVSLTVTDNDGLTHTITDQVTTLPPASQLPIALFSYVQAGAAVHFDGSTSYDPDGTIASYAWEYGDGNTGAGQTSDHRYPAVGTFTAVLRVTDNDGDVGATSRDIVVDSLNLWPTAAYTWTADGLLVDFDGSTSSDPDGDITFWHWYFGDGTPMGDGETVQHLYPSAGTFTCTLVVHDDETGWGQQQQTLTLVRANQPPVAAFTWTADELRVTFDGRSSTDPDGTIASYAWDFDGDGTSIVAQPQHTFPAAGDYNVELTVTDNQGATGVTNRVVTVAENRDGPTARFVMDPVVDTLVTFDGSTSSDTTGTIDVWAWQFGDGTTAAGVSTTHNYNPVGGPYAATLTVTDDNGDSDSTTRDVNFGPTARFVATVDDLNVELDGSGSTDRDGTITSWVWAIDGDPESGESVTVTLPAGDHQVNLLVTDDGGLTNATLQTVTTTDPPGPPNERPTADFSWVVDSLAVSFNGTYSTDPEGPVASYAWTFGDSGVGVGSNPVHSYDTAGTYTVRLVVTDLQGLASLPAVNDVTVTEVPKVPPVASFEYVVTGSRVDFDARSSYDPDGVIEDWIWDFGDTRDREPGYGEQTFHVYPTSGEKIVYLVVTDNDQLQSTQSRIVDVVALNLPPVIDFEWDDGPGVTTTIDFHGLGDDPDGSIVGWAWDFGDGSTGAQPGRDITHTFPSIDTYVVRCQAVDNQGAPSNIVTKNVTLHGALFPPVAVQNHAVYWGLIQADGSDSFDPDGTVVAWEWDFGDGTGVHTGETVEHQCPTSYGTGTKNATLTVTDDDGLTNTLDFTFYIQVVGAPPIANSWTWDTQPGRQLNTYTAPVPGAWGHLWVWGDGRSDNFASGSGLHYYDEVGTYEVSLQIYLNGGYGPPDIQTVVIPE